MNGEPNSDDRLPAALVERLRRSANRRTVLVPREIDDAILAKARTHFGRLQRQQPARNVWWWAAAACFVAAILAVFSLRQPRYDRADIDRSGQVDILDAFALARRIQQDGARDFDINGDGAVNKADVDAIATQAVKLRKGRV